MSKNLRLVARMKFLSISALVVFSSLSSASSCFTRSSNLSTSSCKTDTTTVSPRAHRFAHECVCLSLRGATWAAD